MAEKKLVCEIITPERIVFSGLVDSVMLPGIEGELGILPLHAALVSILKIGEVRMVMGNEKQYAATGPGFVEVSEDKVTVLTESADMAGEIDLERAKQAKEQAEKDLRGFTKQQGLEFSAAQVDLERAVNLIRVAGRRL